MARIRTVKPKLFFDEDLAIHPVKIRYFFIGLFTLADCEGRMEDRPGEIKANIFPYEKFDADSALNALASPVGPREKVFLIRYVCPGEKRYVQIINFKKHQRIVGKEAQTPSLIPAPPEAQEEQGNQPGNNRESIGKAPMLQEGKGREKEGNGVYGKDTSDPKAAGLVQLLKELMVKNNPGVKLPDNFKAWTLEADRLLRLDKREPGEAERVLKFCQADTFWKCNILSMPTFREKYDKLKLKMETSNGTPKGAPAEPGKYAGR